MSAPAFTTGGDDGASCHASGEFYRQYVHRDLPRRRGMSPHLRRSIKTALRASAMAYRAMANFTKKYPRHRDAELFGRRAALHLENAMRYRAELNQDDAGRGQS